LAIVASLSINKASGGEDHRNDFRIWADAAGARHARAAFVEVKDHRVIVRRADGRLAAVDIDRLSEVDKQYVDRASAAHASVPASNSLSLDGMVASLSQQIRGATNWLSRDWKQSLTSLATPETKTASVETDLRPARLATIKVSRQLLAEKIEQDVNKQEYIRDVIASLPVQGPAFTRARTYVRMMPTADRSTVDILLQGVCDTDTVGSTRGVSISSHGVTQFSAIKRLMLTSGGLRALPTVSSANTEIQTTGIDASQPRLRGRIARRIASSRVDETRGQATWESARHAEQRINAALDREVEELLAQIRPQLHRTMTELAAVERDTGYVVRYSTTPLHVVIRVEDPNGERSVLPPVLPDDRLVLVQAHGEFVKQVIGNERLRRLLSQWTGSDSSQTFLVSARQNGIDMRSRWSRDGNWLTIQWDRQKADEPEDRLARQ